MIPFYERRQTRLAVQQFRQDFQFPPHLHAQMEIAYCRQGCLTVTIGESSQVLRPGEIAVILPDIVHSYATPPGSQTSGDMLIYDLDLIYEQSRALRGKQPRTPYIAAADCHPDAAYAFDALWREWQEGPDPLVCRALLGLLTARLLPHLSLQERRDAPDDLLHQALLYLSEHYTEAVRLPQVARALNASAYHLSHLFAARLGMGFCAYVNALRLNRAQTLLQDSALSITQISFDCGFESQRTFNRVFLSQLGMTPRQFRRQIHG